MEIYKAKELAKYVNERNVFYDLAAVNSLTTYCLAKKMNFIRIYTSLDNDDIVQNCRIQSYAIIWIVGMSVAYLCSLGILVIKAVTKKQQKADTYG